MWILLYSLDIAAVFISVQSEEGWRMKTCAHVHGAFMKHRNERGGLTCGQQGGAPVRTASPQMWRLHRDAVLKGSIKDEDEDRILRWHFKSAVPV